MGFVATESSQDDADKIIPPFRYAPVEDGLYRGAYPTHRNFRHLRRLKLRTIVSLTPQKPSEELTNFCKEENIHLRWSSASKFKGEVALPASLVAEILEIIINPIHFPLYLHCLDGGNNTGMVVACMRKLQNWNTSVIHAEFSRFVRPKTGLITSTEVDFIESFQSVITVPEQVPRWLWGGLRILKHPTIPLKTSRDTASADLPAAANRNPQSAAAQSASGSGAVVSLALEALDISVPWPKKL